MAKRARTPTVKQISRAIARRTKDRYEIVLASETSLLVTDWLSMGVTAFDKAVGEGLPWGRIVEIYGPWSAGKTALVLDIIAEAQDEKCITVLYDAEGSLEDKFARSKGVDLSLLLYCQPQSLERTFRSILSIIRYVEVNYPGKKIVFALDSLAAFPAEEEILVKKETKKRQKNVVDKRTMGMRRAAIISSFLKQMNTKLSKGQHLFIFTNQMRDQLMKYGDPDVTVGGQAVKFHAGVRIKVSQGRLIKKGKRIIGRHGKLVVRKSKVGVPFRYVNFRISLDGQIKRLSGYLDFLVREGKVTKVRRKSKKDPQKYRYVGENGKAYLFSSKSFSSLLEKRPELQ